MQSPQHGEVAKSSKDYLMFGINNIANNLITGKGCESLAKAYWPLI